MVKTRIQNWHDRNGSELDKAQEILDSDMSGYEISMKTGINASTLGNIRNGKHDLENSKWATVNKLSQLWDIIHMEDELQDNDRFVYFMTRFQFLIKEEYQQLLDASNDPEESYADDKATAEVLRKLGQIVLTDPEIMVELFKTYKKQLPDDFSWDSLI